MARRPRNYAAEYRRRIALGEARGVTRAEARGHRSLADLRDVVTRGRVELVDVLPGEKDPATGRYRTILVVTTRADGTEQTYTLRGRKASIPALRRLAKDLERSGIGVTGVHYLGVMQKKAAA